MTDPDIIKLFLARDENAITETRTSYGGYMTSIARRILRDDRDAEETVSDACLAAWGSIPPNMPRDLGAYVGKLTRNAAIDRARANSRKKRGGEFDTVFMEAAELVPDDGADPAEAVDTLALSAEINRFLREQPAKKRRIFVQRYWYIMSCEEIARSELMPQSSVRTLLTRMRAELKKRLIKEGLYNE